MVFHPLQWLLRRRLLKRLPPLTHVRSVLVLCTANRVRSPFAEAILKRHAPSQLRIRSRGVMDGGSHCPGEAIDAAQRFGVDLSTHHATKVAPEELLQADLLVVMELRMAHDLVTRYPALTDKVVPLRTFDPQAGAVADIDDPYLLPASEYHAAYSIIARCCEALGQRLSLTNAGL